MELYYDKGVKNMFSFDTSKIDINGNRRFIRNQVIEIAKQEKKANIKTYWNYFRTNTSK